LRVALAMFKSYREPHIVELGKRASALSSKLGPARDLDVFLAEMIEEPKSVDPHSEGFGLLTARAEKLRGEAWDQAADCIAGPGFALFLDDVAMAAEGFHANPRPGKILGKVAQGVLDKALERAKKKARAAKSDPEAFHHLRIALKKLRYTSEFLAPLYDEKSVRRYLKNLKALQERLGQLNDGAHLRTTLGHLREAGSRKANQEPSLQFALGAVEGWYSAQTKSLMKKSRNSWRDFRDLTPFWC
jgi:CHAD domain-containing protein